MVGVTILVIAVGFNPLHRGMGVLTRKEKKDERKPDFGFNPLHRGMGVLTPLGNLPPMQLEVSILYIEAWGY